MEVDELIAVPARMKIGNTVVEYEVPIWTDYKLGEAPVRWPIPE